MELAPNWLRPMSCRYIYVPSAGAGRPQDIRRVSLVNAVGDLQIYMNGNNVIAGLRAQVCHLLVLCP